MTMKYIYLNPTLYIQWIINIACIKCGSKNTNHIKYSKNNINAILHKYNGN